MEQLPVNTLIMHVAHATRGQFTKIDQFHLADIRGTAFDSLGHGIGMTLNVFIVHDGKHFFYLKNRYAGVTGHVHLLDELPHIAKLCVERAQIEK